MGRGGRGLGTNHGRARGWRDEEELRTAAWVMAPWVTAGFDSQGPLCSSATAPAQYTRVEELWTARRLCFGIVFNFWMYSILRNCQ